MGFFLCHSLATTGKNAHGNSGLGLSYPILLKMCLRVGVRVTVGLRLEKLELGLSYLILLNVPNVVKEYALTILA